MCQSWSYVCVYVHLYICMLYTHTYVYIPACVYIYIYMHVCIFFLKGLAQLMEQRILMFRALARLEIALV